MTVLHSTAVRIEAVLVCIYILLRVCSYLQYRGAREPSQIIRRPLSGLRGPKKKAAVTY